MNTRWTAAIVTVCLPAFASLGANVPVPSAPSPDAKAVAAQSETGTLSVTVRSGPTPLTAFVVIDGPSGRQIGVFNPGAPAVFADLEPGEYEVTAFDATVTATVNAGQTTSVRIIAGIPNPL